MFRAPILTTMAEGFELAFPSYRAELRANNEVPEALIDPDAHRKLDAQLRFFAKNSESHRQTIDDSGAQDRPEEIIQSRREILEAAEKFLTEGYYTI